MATKKANASLVVDRYISLRDQRKDLNEHWYENCFRKYYLSRDYTDQERFDIEMGIKSNVVMATEIEYTQTKIPRIMNRFFSARPMMRIIADDEKSVKGAKSMEASLEKDFRDSLYQPMDMVTNQCVMYGTGILTHRWVLKKEAGNLIDRVGFDWCDLFEFYIIPTYWDVQEAPYCIRRVLKPISYLEAHPEIYDPKAVALMKEEEVQDEKEDESYLGKRLQILKLAGSKMSDEKGKNKTDKSEKKKIFYAELLEHWENDRVMTVGNRKHMLRDKGSPFKYYKPFWVMRDYPIPELFYGLGEIDVLASGPRYAEDTKNMRIDIMKRVAYPGVKVGKGAMVDPKDLIPQPYQVIRCADIEQVQEFGRADVKKSMYMEEQIANSDMENKTSIYSYLKGGYSPRGETATTTGQMVASGDERILKMVNANAMCFLKPLAEKTAMLKKMNMQRKIWQRVVNLFKTNYEEISKESLEGSFTFEPNIMSTKTMSDIALQQVIGSIYDRLKDSPNVIRYGLDKFLLEAFDIKSIDQILKETPETEVMENMRGNPEMLQKLLMMSEELKSREAANAANMAGGSQAPVEAVEAGGPPEGMISGVAPVMTGPGGENV